MKVLLVNPPIDFRDKETQKRRHWVIYYPSGLLHLGTILNNEKFEIKILDLIAKQSSEEETEEIIKEFNPDVVGISATTPQIRGAVSFAKLVRKINKKIKIVIGGPHVTADPGFFKRLNYFDYAITGEGEISFSELLNDLRDGKEVESQVIPGKSLEDLDKNGFLNMDLVDREDYMISPYGSNFLTVHTSRGCPFNCVYCSNPVGKRFVRYRDVKKVLDEIEYHMKNFEVKFILFTDDTFTLNRKRTRELLQGIIDRGIKLKWSCETRANMVDEDLIKLMKEAGCIEIAFGVESGSEELRQNIIHKGVDNKSLINAFNLCRKYKIESAAFCMLGFPGETKEDMYETLDFTLKINPDLMGLHLTVPMPGSEIYQQAIDSKIITEDYWDKYAEGEIKEQPIYIPEGFTREELEGLQKEMYHKYYFRVGYMWKRFCKNLKQPGRFFNDSFVAVQLFFNKKSVTGRLVFNGMV